MWKPYLHEQREGTMPPIWIDPNDTTRRAKWCWCVGTRRVGRTAALPFHFHCCLHLRIHLFQFDTTKGDSFGFGVMGGAVAVGMAASRQTQKGRTKSLPTYLDSSLFKVISFMIISEFGFHCTLLSSPTLINRWRFEMLRGTWCFARVP